MLGAAAAILLCSLLSQVNALTAEAKCRSEYEWMSSSLGQSPCDLAVELATVCYQLPYTLGPIGAGYYYLGPSAGKNNSCLCSSVFYSLLSACAYCQGAEISRWTAYSTNCTTVHLGVYTQQIPVGVKVPAYAYQDVSLYGQFNVTVAYDMRGVESSRALPSSTITPRPTSSSSSSLSLSSSSFSTTANGTATTIIAQAPANTPAIVGGVVGGLVSLGLIAACITLLVLRLKQRSQSQNYNSGIQHSSNVASSPGTTASFVHSGKVYNPNDRSTYPSDMSEPYSDPNLTAGFTNGTKYASPQTMKQNTAVHYPGVPEL